MKTNFIITTVLGLLLAGNLACHAQKVGQYVDLSPTAKVYQSPSTSSKVIGFESEEALRLLNDGKPLYPFAQQVLAVKDNWLQIPGGWVQTINAKVDAGTITESMMEKNLYGAIMNEDNPLGYEFRIRMFDKSQRLAVVTMNKIVMSAKFVDNTLVCNRAIRIYSAEYKSELDHISFTYERERNGLKYYNVHYGERMMVQVESYFSGNLEYEPALEPDKLTPEDWKVFYDHVNSVGTPMQFAISAKTLQLMSEEPIKLPKRKISGPPLSLSEPSSDNSNSNKESENVNDRRHLSPEPEPMAPPVPVKEEPKLAIIEQSSYFPGGEEALQSYLDKNLKIPRAAKKKENQRPVVVSFAVEKDGSLTEVAIREGVHPSMDEEALRVVRGMPKWRPYTQNHQAIRSYTTLEISFQRKK